MGLHCLLVIAALCFRQAVTKVLKAVEEHACLSFLEELRATAPYLRLRHLRDCLAKAKRRNDEKAVKAITRILKREHDRKKYGRLRGAFGKPRALPSMQIEVPNANPM